MRETLLLLCFLSIAAFSSAADTEIEPAPAEWEQAVAQLRADEYAEREKAAAALAALPRSALPWLEARLAASVGDDDPEFLRRLSGAVRAITQRQAELDLENGLQVSIDLKSAKPEDVLAQIAAAAPRGLLGENLSGIWDEPEPADFHFEGSYWEAVDKLFSVFPPQAAKDPGREELNDELSLVRFEAADLAAVGQPRVSAGVLHVRAARTALEHSNGKDYFTVTLVPKLEPAYIPDEVALLIKGVHFGDGNSLVPAQRVRSFERSGYRSDATTQPGRTFTWAIPIDAEVERSKPVMIEALMQVKVRRMEWREGKLPPVNGSVGLTGTITATVEEQAKESIKIKFAGPEGTRIDFNQYSRGGTVRLFDLLDEAGEKVDFRVHGSSSGGGGSEGWHQSFTCSIQKGEPVAVRALLPGEPMTSQLPIDLDGVPLPGMAARE